MPIGAPHKCAEYRCTTLVPKGRSRCEIHQRATATTRGYDARWRKYRLGFLQQHPLCVLCAVSGPPGGNGKPMVVAATVVDHIRAHKGDQQLFDDPNNHRAVCKPHHDSRTDEGDFGRTQ